ncbi:MAG: DUF853 family protein [Alphaproteobacteria bacterium]|nr:DUF853 family protein [Alphaproteobacteria bacterium]
MPVQQNDKLFLGASSKPEYLALRFANRHGLVAGATGTGKTITLQILAEGFSNAGVPVFCADIKGDVAGLAASGEEKDFLIKRAKKIKFAGEYRHEAFPVVFWDLFGKDGHPIRTTVSEMGPLLLARILGLNETQEGVLNIAFRLADDEGLLLLDLKDLRALLAHVAERASELGARYGNVSKASVGALQRSLLVLEEQGGARFFGEPALHVSELIRTTRDGRGVINILAANTLMQSPRLYATFLLWLLSELFEELPEIGDPEKPRLVFFFDEAHLLFEDAPKALLKKIEQIARLIRSKGVGIYFVTQNPLDVPDTVLSQLGNRIQHALRAFTPRDMKAVKAAADTFRPNPEFSAFEAITRLEVGEALVSTLEGKGVPSVVQRTLIRPPSSRIGTLTAQERRAVIAASPIGIAYDKTVDRESAYEILATDVDTKVAAAPAPAPSTEGQTETGTAGGVGGWLGDILGTSRPRGKRLTTSQHVARSVTRTVTTRVAGGLAAEVGKSVAGSLGASIGRAVVRGILGGILRR